MHSNVSHEISALMYREDIVDAFPIAYLVDVDVEVDVEVPKTRTTVN